ncbi:MAG TPA: pseudouridine synthase [Caulobacterales bacterium]|nr:pseudouridine synthase [Caulobacterales bacterium]
MAWTKRFAGAAPERVNKWLAQSGVCSRREAEALIGQGLVSIDGARVGDPGHKIMPGQTLTLADGAGEQLRSAVTIVLNKPVGYVSAAPQRGEVPAARLVTAKSLVGKADVIPKTTTKLAPLGRLDQDSRGLLLLSEDGALAKAVIGPESEVDKEYLVRVRGRVTEPKLALLREGLTLDHRRLKRALVERLPDGRLRFVLTEGMKRQIRRMCEAVELHVEDLLRVRIGAVELGDLPEGKWRPLTPEERAALMRR